MIMLKFTRQLQSSSRQILAKHLAPHLVAVQRFQSNSSLLSKLPSRQTLILGGSVFSVTLFGLVMYERSQREVIVPLSSNEIQEISPAAIKLPKNSLKDLKITKTKEGKRKLNGVRFILLQYQTCPFCSKVRAFLDYFGVPYDVVEVHPVTRAQIRFSPVRKVPLLLVDDAKNPDEYLLLNDSSSIISILGSYMFYNTKQKSVAEIASGYKSMLDSDSGQRNILNKYFILFGEDYGNIIDSKLENQIVDERRWRMWTDNHFVHVLSPNIYRTMKESIHSFKYFSNAAGWEMYFSKWELNLALYVGATAMYFIGKRLKKRHNLKDDVRESLFDVSAYWVKCIGRDAPFIGGQKPNLADLSIYGTLSSIEGCKAFQELKVFIKIGPWYYRMKEACETGAGSDLTTLFYERAV